ncbi:helix-turn-helix domain-containing protein [Paenibacillus sp. FSL R5-0486]|uniref:helix-turn-helix transcriptional regulator n=1 Tax=Paenibacillus sp. FSL R5-0486 TaxID=2921645 RepID=UPI0030DDD915
MGIFSDRLKWLREKNMYTQKDMAEALDVSQPYYGKFEKGTGEPNLETLVKLPKIFGESLDFICGITALDSRGKELMNEYCDLRHRTEDGKRRLTYSIELLEKTDIALDLENKLELIANQKSRINLLEDKFHRTYNKLVEHISSIPGMTAVINYATTEYLDLSYEEYRKEKSIREIM